MPRLPNNTKDLDDAFDTEEVIQDILDGSSIFDEELIEVPDESLEEYLRRVSFKNKNRKK